MSDRWVSPSGKVHLRRQRWYVGTRDERAADPNFPIMLCGQRLNLKQVSDDTELTCGTCLKAKSYSEAHPPREE